MSENLGVRITASLDRKKSISEINADLKNLETKLNKIDLDLGIDVNALNKLVNSSELKNVKGKLNEAFSVDKSNFKEIEGQLNKIEKAFGGTFDKIRRQGKVSLVDGQLNTDDIKKWSAELKDAEGVMRKFTISKNKIGEYKIVNMDEITNLKKARDESEKLANSMADGRVKSQLRSQNEELKEQRKQHQAINKQIDQLIDVLTLIEQYTIIHKFEYHYLIFVIDFYSRSI